MIGMMIVILVVGIVIGGVVSAIARGRRESESSPGVFSAPLGNPDLGRGRSSGGAGLSRGDTSTGASADDVAWKEQLHALIRERRMIDAIKLYRTRTGLGLKESKDAVDAIRASL